MKEIQVTLPSDRKTLMDEFIKEFSLSATSYDFREAFRYELMIDNYQTNMFIEELKARGIGSAYGEIIVRPVELRITSKEKADTLPESAGVNREEIISDLGNISGFSKTYLLLCALAASLAALGLLNNDAIVILSSMIVAPLIGPIILTSIGLLSLETTSFVKRGILAEITGISAVTIIAAIIGLFIQSFDPVSFSTLDNTELTELFKRADFGGFVGVFSISLALLGGLAAGIIVARGLDVSIVGVAIAASLCPPAAAIGIFSAYFMWDFAFNAAILLLLNVLAINLSCTAVFWIFGVKSRGLSKRQAQKVRRMNILWIISVTILLIILILLTRVN
ncbi:MAG: TIGR00341 family protein [Candidatus Hodarchaeales archaeon]